MTQIKRQAIVPYSPKQMYDLVNDVESYPLFLNGCDGVQILSSSAEQMEAKVQLKKGLFKTHFVTRNTLKPEESIQMHLVSGPLKSLDGLWVFTALGDSGTRVDLDIVFETSSSMLGRAAGAAFENIANEMLANFCERANEVYPDA